MMTPEKQTVITKDAGGKKLFVVRNFDAPLEQVWSAWTEKELLDKWWAPKPWKARTKSMDFREGGRWLYCMEGPDGERQWCRLDYKSIGTYKSFNGIDGFCDEEGNTMNTFPSMHWKVEFSETEGSTKVAVEITFNSEADLQKIVDMGFKEGFTAAHGNLDELLAK